LATREFDAAAIRRVTLALTVHAATQACLAEVLSALSLTEQ
jgi:hypothetical protein